MIEMRPTEQPAPEGGEREAIVLTSQVLVKPDGFEVHGIFSSFHSAALHVVKDADLGPIAEKRLLGDWSEPGLVHSYEGPGADGQASHWCASLQPVRDAALTRSSAAPSEDSASSPDGAVGRVEDVEGAAWSWMESKWFNVEAGDDPNDRDYSPDEMIDAFMAGAALTASSTSGLTDGGARPPAIYLAARFSQRPECNALAHRLKALGCTITSRWVRPDDDHVLPTGLSRQAEDSERRRFAMEDCEDVRASDWIVSLQGEPRSGGRGGRHIEFGYALALGKRMVSIGPRETVFHHMDEVEQFDTADEFIASLAQPDAVTRGMPDRGEG